MIRLIQRRLIIPRGDTGSFTIPVLGTAEGGDVAVFCIFDPMTHKKVFSKNIYPDGENLEITFEHQETAKIRPGKYLWDIQYYKNPEIDDDKIINGEEINSYYAGFSLPVCEIRETAENWPHEEDDILVNTNISTLQTILKSLPSAIGEKF